MPDSPIGRVLSAVVADGDTAPDGDLLRRFAEGKDATAFELLVHRHAGLVWGVCRAALPRDPHAAEDVFQAVFLALARKAGAVRDRSAAGWLFRVARNTAVRARGRAAGRAAGPLPDEFPGSGGSPAETAGADEVARLVAEEVDRLAAKYRDPVVLCFFEGHTHAEAAEQLGWSIGTVASRLARAKDQLRARLTRRGVGVPVAGLATVLASRVTGAAPVILVRATVAMATGASGPIPVQILSLTAGVLTAMRFAQLKVVAAAVAAVIAVSATAAFATRYSVEGPPANPPAATPGGAPAWAAGPDLNALAGVWTGQGMTAKFAYDKVTWSGPDLPLSVTMRVKLAPEKAPKEIDLIVSGGPENGRVLPGVYDLRGDTLTVCFANQNGEKGAIRPKGLGAGEGVSRFVLERVRDEKAELAALAGEWTAIELDENGKAVPKDEVARFRLILKDREARFSPGESGRGETAKVKLDPSKLPKEIDLTYLNGPDKGKTLPGIYELKGDTLRICLRSPDHLKDGRPTGLKGGRGLASAVLQRVPKK